MLKELNLNDLSKKARLVYEVSSMNFEKLADGNYIKTDADHKGEMMSLEQINDMLEFEYDELSEREDS